MSNREQVLKLFGEALRKARRENCALSQEQFAHEAGLDRSYVGQVERGERNVSLEIIVRLAQTAGVPSAELFKLIDAAANPGIR